jgi:P27 family predicted phage terminase small subunit
MPQRVKPTALLEIEKGKLYGDQRDRAELEPKARKELKPRCPQRLSREERKEWKYFASILRNYGLFTIANAAHLELLACSMAQYKDCAGKVSKTGIVIKGINDVPTFNPYWNAVNKLEDKICRCLAELGLSSTGLAKMGSLMLRHKKQKTEMEELLD